MVVGFNHNFRYKGVVYHIQTEDGGLRSPNIVTLLYRGGTILASQKTCYADIAKVDNLERVVEELMKEQHKAMLRNLKSGEYDAAIERYEAARTTQREPAHRAADIAAESPPAGSDTSASRLAGETPVPETAAARPGPVSRQPLQANRPTPVETSLDEIILSYLMGDEK